MSLCDGVYVEKDNQQKTRVAAPSPYITALDTHASGRGIHFLPGSISLLTTAGLTLGPFQHDPIPRNLNPREFLSSENISLQQRLFPTAVEVRFPISGFTVILFQSRSDIEKSWPEDGKASEYGFLRLVYEVIEIRPTEDQIPSGKPDLKIRMSLLLSI